MKPKILALFFAVSFISCVSFAAIRRVGYAGLPLQGVDFATMQSACDSSASGDTIQVYGNISQQTIVTKKLILIGFGYNFDVHPGLQVVGTDAPSNCTNLYFGAGSDGSIVTGLSGTFYVGDINSTQATVSDITFQRCKGGFYFVNYRSYGLIKNIKIVSSVITDGGMQYSSPDDFPVINLQVFNCIISGFSLYKTGTTASFINCVSPHPNFGSSLNLADASVLVKNSIFYSANASANINTVFENNFFSEAQPNSLPPGKNNRWGQDWGTLFKRISNIDDNASYPGYAEFDENYYILKTGSPAIKGGFNFANTATDCGIFGGELLFVYRLSGVPAVPSIYKLTAPSMAATANSYNVTLSVKSNN